jgi:soluble lytic murein transglycosylase-like protein
MPLRRVLSELTVFLVLIFLPLEATAEMYVSIDSRGVAHYSNVAGEGRRPLSEQIAQRSNSSENQLIRIITQRSGGGMQRMSLANAQSPSGYTFRTAPQMLNRYIQLAAANHQVDPRLIKAIIKAESNFDPNAFSSKGAQGLMQLMPATARDMAVHNPLDPGQNIDGGTKYLRYLLDNFKGNVALSLAAYNAGPGNVAPLGRIPRIPETQQYVAKVMKTYRTYRGDRPVSSVTN